MPLTRGDRVAHGVLLISPTRLSLAVVEDDRDVRTALGRLLRSMGHDVRLFESAEAVTTDPQTFDCLVLDLRLPGLSGVEFAERIRREGGSVPVVFITGDMDLTVRERSRVAGSITAPLLTKPFGDDELMDAVARAVSHGR
jgi:FixJ family two-component response regulator